jgi:hypothetical protein
LIVVTRCAETAATAGVVLGYVEPVLADELGQFQRPMFLEAARLPRELLDYSNGLQRVSNINRAFIYAA